MRKTTGAGRLKWDLGEHQVGPSAERLGLSGGPTRGPVHDDGEAAAAAMGEGDPVLVTLFRITTPGHLAQARAMMEREAATEARRDKVPVWIMYGDFAVELWQDCQDAPYCGLCHDREPEQLKVFHVAAYMWETSAYILEGNLLAPDRIVQGRWMGLCGDCLDAAYEVRV